MNEDLAVGTHRPLGGVSAGVRMRLRMRVRMRVKVSVTVSARARAKVGVEAKACALSHERPALAWSSSRDRKRW